MLQTLPVDIKEAATAALWHFVAPVQCLSNQIFFGLDAHQADTLFISVMLMRRSPLYSSAAARQTPESSPVQFLKTCPADSRGDLSKQPQLGGTELPRTRAEMLIITAFPPYTLAILLFLLHRFVPPPPSETRGEHRSSCQSSASHPTSPPDTPPPLPADPHPLLRKKILENINILSASDKEPRRPTAPGLRPHGEEGKQWRADERGMVSARRTPCASRQPDGRNSLSPSLALSHPLSRSMQLPPPPPPRFSILSPITRPDAGFMRFLCLLFAA